MRTNRTFAIRVTVAVIVLGFLAVITVAASVFGWLPFSWLVDGMSKEPHQASVLGVLVLGFGTYSIGLGPLALLYLKTVEAEERRAAADRP